MSKQYLTLHSVDNAHITDIFSLATTSKTVLSASGSSSLQVHATDQISQSNVPVRQTIVKAHSLGCHHIAVSRNGQVAASAGFGGEVRLWKVSESGEWEAYGELDTSVSSDAGAGKKKKAGEVWAIALSEDGLHLAGTTYDGRINVWELSSPEGKRIQEYETGSPGTGSFGLCVDLSRDGKYTASGHQNGAIYVYDNESGKLKYSLPGNARPVRSVTFSPAGKLLAAAGDACQIALFDTKHGDFLKNLTGHATWITSLDFSDTGEYLLSGAFDGKVKVWSIEREACVATHTETDKALWSVKWLPKTDHNEMFVTAGVNRSLTFYREATGG